MYFVFHRNLFKVFFWKCYFDIVNHKSHEVFAGHIKLSIQADVCKGVYAFFVLGCLHASRFKTSVRMKIAHVRRFPLELRYWLYSRYRCLALA